MNEKTVSYRAWEENTAGETYWVCEKCGYVIKAGEYHVCPQGPPAQPVSYSATYPPKYLTILERILESLLRIEKLLEKEL